jgi:hypothetical protein
VFCFETEQAVKTTSQKGPKNNAYFCLYEEASVLELEIAT